MKYYLFNVNNILVYIHIDIQDGEEWKIVKYKCSLICTINLYNTNAL